MKQRFRFFKVSSVQVILRRPMARLNFSLSCGYRTRVLLLSTLCVCADGLTINQLTRVTSYSCCNVTERTIHCVGTRMKMDLWSAKKNKVINRSLNHLITKDYFVDSDKIKR